MSGKTRPTANRAAQALRLAAAALRTSQSALGAYYRRLCARMDKAKAVTAAAHKLARLIYSLLSKGQEYTDQGQAYYEERYRQRVLHNLQRKAQRLGMSLVPVVDWTAPVMVKRPAGMSAVPQTPVVEAAARLTSQRPREGRDRESSVHQRPTAPAAQRSMLPGIRRRSSSACPSKSPGRPCSSQLRAWHAGSVAMPSRLTSCAYRRRPGPLSFAKTTMLGR
ncbi:hypothetical protein [Rubrivivax gelatinosus]|uniref:hypothetical protein n=1 Tax=Rubrivivax gelatinosus TaxID=28068 RepID=UPI0019078EA9|nr:hypothetical protein [Rubrivivax gelatinosus]